jgi:hypothetical protein
MLFSLARDRGEKKNLIAEHPEIAAKLEAKLATWAEELSPKGLPKGQLNAHEVGFYDFYFGND